MSHKAIKFKHQLKTIFYYFQKRHLINRHDSLNPQWSHQAVITVSRSTWKTKNNNNGVATNLFYLSVIGNPKRLYFYKKLKLI